MDIKEFTFIVLAFNQAQYIKEHLESVRKVVSKYGADIQTDLIIADDCSTDETTAAAREWLKEHKSLFRKVLILEPEKNQGTVRNLLSAVNSCNTKHYKFLAADDIYRGSNIFRIYEKLDRETLLATPVIPVGNNPDAASEIRDRYRILKMQAAKKRQNELMKLDNFLAAPGVFMHGDWLREKEVQEYLLQYRNIEDYPLWQYLIFEKGCSIRVSGHGYIDYRLNSGISLNRSNKERSAYEDEIKTVRRDLKARRYLYPKYVNIYCYILKYYRWKIKHTRQRDIYSEIENAGS